MIWLFYACLILGAGLLLTSTVGRLTAPPEHVRVWRTIGLVAAAGPGVVPLLFWLTQPTGVTWPFPLVALCYLAAFLLLAVGVIGPLGGRQSARLRRVGYVGLLLLGALPSFVLLLLAPAILLAGLTLVEPRSTAPVAVTLASAERTRR